LQTGRLTQVSCRSRLTIGRGFPVMATTSVHGSPGRTLVSRNSRVNSGGVWPAAAVLTVLCEDSTSLVLTMCFSAPVLTDSEAKQRADPAELDAFTT